MKNPGSNAVTLNKGSRIPNPHDGLTAGPKVTGNSCHRIPRAQSLPHRFDVIAAKALGAFAKNDCVDEFGVPIPAGRDHYRQGDFYEDAFRLSAQSMHTFMRVLFLNNHLGFKLAEDLHDEFLNKLLTLQRTRADAKSTASQAGAQ